MGKVLNFPEAADKKEWAQEVLKAFMEQGENMSVAIHLPDGDVLTAYWNCDFAQKQILLGHMQVDIINDCMKATYDLE